VRAKSSAAVVAVAFLAIAGCSSSTPTGATTTGPSTSSATAASETAKPAPVPAVAGQAMSDTLALRRAVQAYSDAYLSGKGKAAWSLLSARCQKMDTLAGFSSLVDQAKTLYGNPLPMTSFTAHIAGGMARVTYTYTVTAINQADQPWTLEASGWRDDNC
jgi:hypothetical protein